MVRMKKPIRTVQYNKITKMFHMNLPFEIGWIEGDVYLFERIDESTVKITKVA